MGEFRIGRKYARHVYPDTNRGAGVLAYARNSANTPEGSTVVPVAPGVQLSWATIESGASPGVNVPYTPKVTGVTRIAATVTVTGAGIAAAANVELELFVDGAAIATAALTEGTVDVNGALNLSITADRILTKAAHNIQVNMTALTGADANLVATAWELDVQELPLATG